MNIQKTWKPVATILGVVCGSLLLKKGISKETVNTVVKTVAEPEKTFGGVSLSKLNEVAKEIDPRNWCSIDQWGFLVLHYRSNRGHQTFQTQMELDKTLKLVNLNGGPIFPGQRWSKASEFVRRVNETIKFTSLHK